MSKEKKYISDPYYSCLYVMKSWRVMRTTEPGTLNPGRFIFR